MVQELSRVDKQTDKHTDTTENNTTLAARVVKIHISAMLVTPVKVGAQSVQAE